MPEVVLERPAIEALASETRVTVLKELKDHQKTVAQLSRSLELDKAAVFRHLQKLSEGKLVEKDDSHAFVYYRLTFRGRALVSPGEATRIAIALGLAVLAVAAAAWSWNVYVTPRVSNTPWTHILQPEPLYYALTIVFLLVVPIIALVVFLHFRPRRAKLTPEEQKEEATPLPPSA